MSKYVDRIMDEVHDNFDRHFNDDEKVWFLEYLIERLNKELEYIEDND